MLINQSINRPTNQNVSRQCALRKQKPRHIIRDKKKRLAGKRRRKKECHNNSNPGENTDLSAIGPDVFQKVLYKTPELHQCQSLHEILKLKTTEMAGIFVLSMKNDSFFFLILCFFVNWPSRIHGSGAAQA